MRSIPFVLLFLGLVFQSCSQQTSTTEQTRPANTEVMKIGDYVADKNYDAYGVATFAGGCFWCTEASFERINGVVDVISGYAGGQVEFPTYEQIGTKRTGHTESIQIYYDPEVIDYATLLDVFFVAHDPTTLNRQGPDVGPQYRSAIFYRTDEEKRLIDETIAALNASGKLGDPIVTEVSPYTEFYTAEGYHQNYYELHPNNPYITNVSRPKVEKVKKTFPNLLKEKYRP